MGAIIIIYVAVAFIATHISSQMTALSSGECNFRRQVWTADMTPQCGLPFSCTWSTLPCRWSPWSTSAAFCWLQPFCCVTCQPVYSQQSSLPGRRYPTLEQLAWWHHAGWFTVDLSVPTETLFVPADVVITLH